MTFFTHHDGLIVENHSVGRHGRTAVILLMCLFITAVSLRAQGESAPEINLMLGPEIDVSAFWTGKPANLYQTDLRCNPNDPDNMIITAKNGREQHTVALTTVDGGQTWTAAQQPRSGDPDVVIDQQGTAYWTFIDKSQKSGNSVRRSFDGGQTWEPTQRQLDKDNWIDHPHVAVDRSVDSPFYNSIYIAGRVYPRSRVSVLRTRDGGETWETADVDLPKEVGRGFVHQLGVMNDGTLIVPIEGQNRIVTLPNGRYGGSQRNLYTIRSTDGGLTFEPPVLLSDKDGLANGWGGPTRANSGIAVGPIDGGQRLYYVFPKVQADAPSILMLVTSDDGGVTWTPPRQVLEPTPSGWNTGTPSLMVNADGVLGLAFLSAEAKGSRFDLYFVASADGAQTFSTPICVSGETSTQPAVGTQARELGGDQIYSDVAADGSFRLVWTDNRDGDDTYRIFVRSVTAELK